MRKYALFLVSFLAMAFVSLVVAPVVAVSEPPLMMIRLHGVPPGMETATWWAFHARPVVLPLMRAGDEATIRIPAFSA